MDKDTLWQTKVHARLHDPVEKALVLLRDPEGHDGGKSKAQHRELLARQGSVPAEGIVNMRVDPNNANALHATLFKDGAHQAMHQQVNRADGWAAGADRPNWPMEEVTVDTNGSEEKNINIAQWAQVRWQLEPVLIHPLTGQQFNLHGLSDTDVDDLKRCSVEQFQALIVQDEHGDTDWHKTLLALWRFGPELHQAANNDSLSQIWPVLPADTRVPDHSIWDHLDLTSAFAGSFTSDKKGEVTLLTLSIGPVQSFIAAARSTSDLWAGSHLLSRLSWEAMRVICEDLGPDAVLFPRLRGIPQVDVWLKDVMGLDDTLFKDCSWQKSHTDSNPLFAAALPTTLVAVVPSDQAKALAEKIQQHVRQWFLQLGEEVVNRLFDVANKDTANGEAPAFSQMQQQLQDFPEIHWAAVPFSLIKAKNEATQTDLDLTELTATMAPFFDVGEQTPSGFLASEAWQVLQKHTDSLDDASFVSPKPSALYPAIFDLAARALAAAKVAQPFEQSPQHGWRCSLTGETEWLCDDREQLSLPPGQRKNTLWTAIATKRPSWAKKGEHLGALPAIKRLWPTLFAEEVATALGQGRQSARRFVISTHSMTLAYQLDKWLENFGSKLSKELLDELDQLDSRDEVALPHKLNSRHHANSALNDARRIAGLLEYAKENRDDDEHYKSRCERLIRQAFNTNDTDKPLETYYGMLLLDGDHMGQILMGDPEHVISYRDSFHPSVREGFDEHAKRDCKMQTYGTQPRAISFNRHMAISAALSDFSLHVVPHVVEREHLGRLIYAGGDDVFAMLPAADLLTCMSRLRAIYSGNTDAHPDWHQTRDNNQLISSNGFAMLNGRLMRMMGENASASCGAVIAHHQAPMGAVLRELRAAEQRAKIEGGRNAFCLLIIKRSGAALQLTAKWGEPMDLLQCVCTFLAEPAVSSRAVFHSLAWLRDLPHDAPIQMLAQMLNYQLARQCAKKTTLDAHDIPSLARRLAELCIHEENRNDWLRRFLSVAEFLAREMRHPHSEELS